MAISWWHHEDKGKAFVVPIQSLLIIISHEEENKIVLLFEGLLSLVEYVQLRMRLDGNVPKLAQES